MAENQTIEEECKHYDRTCLIYAKCCDKYYKCRLCHNKHESHEINRFEIARMQCTLCDTKQDISNKCISCHSTMGTYHCSICNLFDHKGSKKGFFHCDDCGICRMGGRDAYFHCEKCGACYSNDLKGAHICVEGSLSRECAICLDYMFNSRENVSVLKCGHAFHAKCVSRALENSIGCPICRTSMIDLTKQFEKLRKIIAENPTHVKETIRVHCHDCHRASDVDYHPYGLECQECNSFNTIRA